MADSYQYHTNKRHHSMIKPDIAAVQQLLDAHGLDAVAFVPGANFYRIMGKDFHLMERPQVVIVPTNGESAAIMPHLEMDSFEQIDFPGKTFYWRDETGYRQAFLDTADFLNALGTSQRFGLEGQRMRVFEQMALAEAFPNASFVDAHQELSAIQLKKTAHEIQMIREAIRISEQALEETLQTVRIGQTETEIQSVLLNRLFANGADALAFSPIVAAGENSALPHAVARDDYQLRDGDALLIDFGAGYKGYNADITRTVFVGSVSDYDRAFYETVRAANQIGKDKTRVGASAHDVDDAVQRVLERSQFREFTLHKTGHGLGLDVHEAPQIMRGNMDKLEAGMIFTIEPGLYRQGEGGVRIEDDVLVTEDGMECLTTFPRELRIVG